MLLKNDFRYRPEIDGLRAVAVVAVVLFHYGFGCSGGYVGVDVFFVISGFLIPSLIWKDLESGRFTFANFWERRARRIVPALVAVTIAALAAGWFLLLPADYENLGQASAAQAVIAANIHYWLSSGYFADGANTKPLIHTWSLAVEEQFYLIVPFLFWLIFRSARLRSPKAVLSLLLAGFGLSFGLSVYGVAHHREATFYLLPTRAWELLLGAIVIFLPIPRASLGRRGVRENLAVLGITLILNPSHRLYAGNAVSRRRRPAGMSWHRAIDLGKRSSRRRRPDCYRRDFIPSARSFYRVDLVFPVSLALAADRFQQLSCTDSSFDRLSNRHVGFWSPIGGSVVEIC
jgi:peptidoglycan/LPS O-acetylase OafA/YrhL